MPARYTDHTILYLDILLTNLNKQIVVKRLRILLQEILQEMDCQQRRLSGI